MFKTIGVKCSKKTISLGVFLYNFKSGDGHKFHSINTKEEARLYADFYIMYNDLKDNYIVIDGVTKVMLVLT